MEDSNIRNFIKENQNNNNKTAHLLVLLYAGSKGEKLIKSMKNSLKDMLPENITTRVTHSRTRLTHFQPMFHYYTPWKHQKTNGSLIFPGGIEMKN